jgi:hypothetical protein
MAYTKPGTSPAPRMYHQIATHGTTPAMQPNQNALQSARPGTWWPLHEEAEQDHGGVDAEQAEDRGRRPGSRRRGR